MSRAQGKHYLPRTSTKLMHNSSPSEAQAQRRYLFLRRSSRDTIHRSRKRLLPAGGAVPPTHVPIPSTTASYGPAMSHLSTNRQLAGGLTRVLLPGAPPAPERLLLHACGGRWHVTRLWQDGGFLIHIDIMCLQREALPTHASSLSLLHLLLLCGQASRKSYSG